MTDDPMARLELEILRRTRERLEVSDRWGWRAVRVLCIALAMALYALVARDARAQVPFDRLVVILGDSNSAPGLWQPRWPARIDWHEGDVLADFSLGGRTLVDWLPSGELYRGSIEPLPFSLYERVLVLIWLGTNDAIVGVHPDVYADALQAICAALLADGADRVLLITPPPIWGDPPAMADLLEAYRAILDAFPGDFAGVDAGPDLFVLLADADLYAHPDGLHVNRAGQEAAAAAISPYVLLPEPQTAIVALVAVCALSARRRSAPGCRSGGCSWSRSPGT